MDAFRVSTDKQALDVGMIHGFLSTQAYWSQGIAREKVETAIAHSLCFGGYREDRQVAFARVITDYACFAYLADVFVLPEYRGCGYGVALIEAVMAHPVMQSVRRFLLTTSDAHALYAKFGFAPLSKPQHIMEIIGNLPVSDVSSGVH